MTARIPTNPAQRSALHDQLSEQARLFATMASAANDDDRRMALINEALFGLVDRIAKNIGRNGASQ